MSRTRAVLTEWVQHYRKPGVWQRNVLIRVGDEDGTCLTITEEIVADDPTTLTTEVHVHYGPGPNADWAKVR